MADGQQDHAAALAATIVAALPQQAPPLSPASALSTINVRTHMPFSLVLDPPNYTRWRELFLTLVGKFGTASHIDGTKEAPAAPDTAWQTIDYVVRSLLYASVFEEILAIVLKPGATARTIWCDIEGLYHDNKASRALSLEAEFRNLAQGDMSILQYSQHLKSYADALINVGQPVKDDTLLL